MSRPCHLCEEKQEGSDYMWKMSGITLHVRSLVTSKFLLVYTMYTYMQRKERREKKVDAHNLLLWGSDYLTGYEGHALVLSKKGLGIAWRFVCTRIITRQHYVPASSSTT